MKGHYGSKQTKTNHSWKSYKLGYQLLLTSDKLTFPRNSLVFLLIYIHICLFLFGISPLRMKSLLGLSSNSFAHVQLFSSILDIHRPALTVFLCANTLASIQGSGLKLDHVQLTAASSHLSFPTKPLKKWKRRRILSISVSF